jgi:hypothetical protein
MTCAKIGYSVFFMDKTCKKALLWEVKDAYLAILCIGVLLRYSTRQNKSGATNTATDDILVWHMRAGCALIVARADK